MTDRHDDPAPAEPPHTPPPQWRGLIAALVAVFLLVQFIIPFRFYRDTTQADERFAWRMFSSVHMSDCAGVLYDVHEEHGVRSSSRVPDDMLLSWRKLLDRGRPDAIDKMMRWRIAQPGVVAVRFVRRCTAPDGTKLPAEVFVLESPDGEVRRAQEPTP